MEDVHTGAMVRELRERVDGVGREPVRIRNERARLVQEIVAAKAGAGKPLFDPKREEEVLRRAAGERGFRLRFVDALGLRADPSPHPQPRNATRRVFQVGVDNIESGVKTGAKTNNGPIHPDREPQPALCNGGQALPVEALVRLRENLRPFARAMGREVV